MKRSAHLWILAAGLVFAMSLFAQSGFSQCVKHPTGRTSVILNNQTKYDLTFFVDDIEKGAVVAGARSIEWDVVGGEHLFGVRAVIQGQGFWVMVVNEVPDQQLCVWTIVDPADAARPPDAGLVASLRRN